MAGAITMTWRVRQDNLPRIRETMYRNAAAIVAKAAMDWEAEAKIRAAVRTGTMKNSIQAYKISNLEWRITVNVHYGAYVEYGTVKMAAQPFFGPAGAVVRPQFLAALKQITR